MDRLPPTSWTMVRDAAANSSAALDRLCATYWTPAYAYIRSRGYAEEAARDLTQSFFAAAIETEWFAKARQERGKFRSFLFTSLRNFLANERTKTSAAKRGGGLALAGEDELDAASSARDGASSPERVFERQYALSVLENALRRLEEEYETGDRAALFRQLRPFWEGDQERGAYASLEAASGMGEGALRVAVYRVRRRFAEVLREDLAETVESEVEVEEEIRFLIAALGREE